jgi:hypothetical protein
MSLLAHCDTKRATEAEVMMVPAPEFTATWHPIPHRDVVYALDNALENIGIGVISKEYSLSSNGAKMFMAWQLDLGTDDIGYELGGRNALDKSMSVGVCAGDRVFVCDNLCFTGSFIMFRKHTSGLDREEMIQIAMTSIQTTIPKMERMVEWHSSLADKYVPENDFKVLAYEMMTRGVFAPGQLNNYLDCLEIEKKITLRTNALAGTRTLHVVHGAATRLMKGWNLLKTARATTLLEGLCNDYLDANPIDRG